MLPRAGPRRWLRMTRHSTRGLMLAVLGIATGLGWIARGARIQRDAVAEIRSTGGWVWYDFEFRNGDYARGRKRWAPRWLVDFVGVDYFGHVTRATLLRLTDRSDEVLAKVGCLARLRWLCVFDSKFSDAGLAHLEGLTELRELRLRCTPTSDAGLAHLRRMVNLSLLDVAYTEVGDAGLLHLERLTELTELRLYHTSVSRAGEEKLRRALPKLTILR
jgi:hypothetical protein